MEEVEIWGYSLIGLVFKGRAKIFSVQNWQTCLDTSNIKGFKSYQLSNIKNPPKVFSKSQKISPVRMLWNAVSTLVESRAEVSINESWLDSAKDLASSVGTALRCLRSDLLPTSMITMLASAWSRNSRNHRSTFSYVKCLAMS